jgi:hypothetical protein
MMPQPMVMAAPHPMMMAQPPMMMPMYQQYSPWMMQPPMGMAQYMPSYHHPVPMAPSNGVPQYYMPASMAPRGMTAEDATTLPTTAKASVRVTNEDYQEEFSSDEEEFDY